VSQPVAQRASRGDNESAGIAFLQRAAGQSGQGDGNKTIIFRNMDLKDVVPALAEQIGLTVQFDSSVRPRKINVDERDITVAQALDKILRDHQLTFRAVNEKTIIVTQKAEPNTSPQDMGDLVPGVPACDVVGSTR
jgi:type II secretory pathway component GspD/PulD (secretin)